MSGEPVEASVKPSTFEVGSHQLGTGPNANLYCAKRYYKFLFVKLRHV